MITAEHVIAAVLLGLACIATGWAARGGWDRAGRHLGELADLDDPEAGDRWADLLAPAALGAAAGELAELMATGHAESFAEHRRHCPDGVLSSCPDPAGMIVSPPPGTWTEWELAHLHPDRERAVTPGEAWAEWKAAFAAGTDRLIAALRSGE
jgi:hypothetical protein